MAARSCTSSSKPNTRALSAMCCVPLSPTRGCTRSPPPWDRKTRIQMKKQAFVVETQLTSPACLPYAPPPPPLHVAKPITSCPPHLLHHPSQSHVGRRDAVPLCDGAQSAQQLPPQLLSMKKARQIPSVEHELLWLSDNNSHRLLKLEWEGSAQSSQASPHRRRTPCSQCRGHCPPSQSQCLASALPPLYCLREGKRDGGGGKAIGPSWCCSRVGSAR